MPKIGLRSGIASWLASAAFLPITVWAQGLATVSGSVTDPSGAAVPGARITITEVETKVSRTTVSTLEGLYTLSALRPTEYTLSAEAPAFKSSTQTGITLQANDSATIPIRLEIGQTNDSVTVDAAALQVDTASSTLKQVVDSQRIIELPLNGRNAATLTTLVTGAVIAPSNDADEGITKTFPVAVTVSINGTRANQTSYSLDGVPNTDFLSNINLPFPMPDALQEFSVQTSNYGAEYGQNVGGVVNLVTRSGANEFHGSLFEYVRNADFNARNSFAIARDPLKRNQFGGSLGGPVIRNKIFFFGGYQGTRIHSENSGLTSTVPTDANLTGDFSAALSATNPNNPQGKVVQIKSPAGVNYPGNIIPASQLDPAALKLADTWLPRAGGNGIIRYSTPIIQNLNEFTAKGDYNISSSDRLSLRYFFDSFDTPGSLSPANLLTYADITRYGFHNAAIEETHIAGANIVNDFRFGFLYESDLRGPPANSPSVNQFGVNITQAAVPAIEGINVSGFFNFGSFPQGQFPRAGFSWADTLRIVKGRHTMAFGGSFERDRLNEFTATNSNGVFAFSGNTTGSALADFMIGKMGTFTQGNGYVQANRYNLFSIFATDTFKVNSRLTLNYGLRWEPSLPWHDLYHEAEVFDPSAYAAGRRSTVYPNAPIGELFSGDVGIPVDGRKASWNNYSARLGFAYDPFGDGKTSIRGAIGNFYDSRVPGFANNRQSQATPFSLAVTLTNPTSTFSNPYAGYTNPFPAPLPPPHTTVFPAPVLVYSWAPNDRLGQVTYNANLTIERQLAANWLARAAYVGSRSNHIEVNVQLNPAVYSPGVTTATTDARRVYPGFSTIPLASSAGNSWYNSLQLSLEKRLSQNFTVTVNYTWSKNLDNIPLGEDTVTPTVGATFTMPPTIHDYQSLDRGPADSNHASVLSSSYVWHLPALAKVNPFLREVAGRWDLNGILTAQTGGPLTITAGSDRSLTGINADKGVLVPGQDLNLSGACATTVACQNFLNPAAFAIPALGTFGNMAKGTLTGPGRWNWDFSTSKQFQITERLRLQFRGDLFNILNHPNPGNPATSLSSGSGFGQIRTVSDPRIAQLALKLLF